MLLKQEILKNLRGYYIEQKSTLDRHIDSISNKKIISFSDLIKLNNYNNI